jgi:hypothetical protein
VHPLQQRPALLLLASLLLLSCLAHAAIIPSRVVEADYYLYEHRLINATSGAMTDLTINLSLPLDDEVVYAPPSSSVQHDSWGNAYLFVSEPSPSIPYLFVVNTSVHVSREPLRSLPIPAPLLQGEAPYLASTQRLPAADSSMQTLARQITENASTPFERVALLAEWTHSYIRYDATTVGSLPDVPTILEQRRGVCTEYTLLFSSLARSLGYPTRFVDGYAYSAEEDAWQGHSWAEVWLGKWVPVDPTWLEVGSLDATHIVLTKGPMEQLDTISISAMVPGSGELTLEHEPSAGLRAEQVHPMRLVPAPLDAAPPLHVSSAQLPPGGQAVVWMAYNSSEYGLLSAVLSTCSSPSSPITRVPVPSMTAISEPNRTYYFIWPLQAASGMDLNYIYRCPLSARTDLADTPQFPLTITDELSNSWPLLSATLEHSSLTAGERQRVFVRLPPSLAGQPVRALEPHMLLSSPSNPGGQASFDFVPSGLGSHTLYVFSTRGDPVALTYSVQESALPKLELSGDNASITEGQPLSLTLSVSGLNSSGPLVLAWTLGEHEGNAIINASQSATIPLTLTAPAAGDALLVVRLRTPAGAELERQAFPLHIWPKTDLSISSLRLQSYSSDGWRVLLDVQSEGGAREPMLVMQNASWPVPDDGMLRLILPTGRYPATLRWLDASGGEHEKPTTLDVIPPQPPVPIPSSSETSSSFYDMRAIPVLVFLALVFAGLMGAALYLRIESLRHSSGSSDPLMRALEKSEGQKPADESDKGPGL